MRFLKEMWGEDKIETLRDLGVITDGQCEDLNHEIKMRYEDFLEMYIEKRCEEDLEENGKGTCLCTGRVSSFDPPDGPEEWEYESRHEKLEEEIRKEWDL